MLSRNFIRVSRFSRGFATHANTTPAPALPAVLHLKTGQSFKGRSFGAPKSIYGETVFSTSITSCESRELNASSGLTLTFRLQTPSQ